MICLCANFPNDPTEKTVMLATKDDDYEAKYRARVKPCPFCGNAPTIMSSGEQGSGLMIHCVADQCANPSVSYYKHEMTLGVWNRRHGQ